MYIIPVLSQVCPVCLFTFVLILHMIIIHNLTMYEILQDYTNCFVFPHLEKFAMEILSALCSLVMKSTDKNSCTRALWVISKQSFPADVVAKKVSKEQKIELRKIKRRWY